MLFLDAGVPHALNGLEDSSLLVTKLVHVRPDGSWTACGLHTYHRSR
jgi:hypothetical protein